MEESRLNLLPSEPKVITRRESQPIEGISQAILTADWDQTLGIPLGPSSRKCRSIQN
jgi:hypothetical protein